MTETAAEPDPLDTDPSQPDGAAGLGRRLRGIYDKVANEPLPDMFEDLLRRMQ